MRGFAILGLLVLVGCPGFGSEELNIDPTDGPPGWEEDIRPLMVQHCVSCHTAPPQGGAPSDFRLDLYDRSEAGELDGAFERRSRIIARAVDNMPSVMPFGGPPLADEQKALLLAWVDAGAPR